MSSRSLRWLGLAMIVIAVVGGVIVVDVILARQARGPRLAAWAELHTQLEQLLIDREQCLLGVAEASDRQVSTRALERVVTGDLTVGSCERCIDRASAAVAPLMKGAEQDNRLFGMALELELVTDMEGISSTMREMVVWRRTCSVVLRGRAARRGDYGHGGLCKTAGELVVPTVPALEPAEHVLDQWSAGDWLYVHSTVQLRRTRTGTTWETVTAPDAVAPAAPHALRSRFDIPTPQVRAAALRADPDGAQLLVGFGHYGVTYAALFVARGRALELRRVLDVEYPPFTEESLRRGTTLAFRVDGAWYVLREDS